MRSRLILWSGLGAVGLFGAIGGAWILSLPSAPTDRAAPQIGNQETEALLAALKPPKRQRPVIAIIGINDATETTDYLMPYGVLRRSNVADVALLATNRGPVKLFPVLTVEPQATVAEFDTQHPDAADYVVVPAMSRDDDPAALAWIKKQAAKGATIIGVCGSQGRRRSRAARRQTSDDALVLPQGVAREASQNAVRRGSSACG